MGYFAAPKYYFWGIFWKNLKLHPPGGKIFKNRSKIIENSHFLHIIIILPTLTLLDIHKTSFSIDHDGISSKLIAQQWGLALYMGTPGGQIAKFWPKWPQILVLCK